MKFADILGYGFFISFCIWIFSVLILTYDFMMGRFVVLNPFYWVLLISFGGMMIFLKLIRMECKNGL